MKNVILEKFRMVLSDLNKRGKISDSVYSSLNLALTYVAPAVFYAAKQTYKLINQISDDIEKNGCNGCFRRNCRKNKNNQKP